LEAGGPPESKGSASASLSHVSARIEYRQQSIDGDASLASPE